MSDETKEAPKKTALFKDSEGRKMTRPTIDGFDNFLSRVGLNNDNSLSDSTYTFNLITRNRILLEAAYRGSWVVGAVIDSIAQDMTRAGVDIKTSDSEVDLELLQKAETRLQIWESLCTGLTWGRLYGGALGVLQIDGQDPATPLDIETIGLGQFKGIAIYDRWMLNPVLSPVIPEGPDMGLPITYQIVSSALQSLGGPTDPDRDKKAEKQYGAWGTDWRYTGIVNVHHTRCIRFIGVLLPFFQAITEMMWGESVLERLWDRLISFDNASMSSAQLVDRANLRTVKLQGFREIIAAGGAAMNGLAGMFNMMRLAQVNEGLTLLDKEDDFDSTSYSFAGLSDLLLQLAQQLAGASGIPLRRLMSQQPAGLGDSGDSDIRLYYDNCNAQQESRLRKPYDIVLKVLWRSVYGKASPKDLDFNFTPLWQLSDTEKVANAKTAAETVTGVFESGLISQKTAMQELRDSSGSNGLFSNITEEDINAADEELPPTPDEQAQIIAEQAPEEGEEKKAPKEKAKDSKGLFRWLSQK